MLQQMDWDPAMESQICCRSRRSVSKSHHLELCDQENMFHQLSLHSCKSLQTRAVRLPVRCHPIGREHIESSLCLFECAFLLRQKHQILGVLGQRPSILYWSQPCLRPWLSGLLGRLDCLRQPSKSSCFLHQGDSQAKDLIQLISMPWQSPRPCPESRIPLFLGSAFHRHRAQESRTGLDRFPSDPVIAELWSGNPVPIVLSSLLGYPAR